VYPIKLQLKTNIVSDKTTIKNKHVSDKKLQLRTSIVSDKIIIKDQHCPIQERITHSI